jgi:hypothetical protein
MITMADLILFELVVSVGNNIPGFGQLFPSIESVYQTVRNVERIKTYVASKTSFFIQINLKRKIKLFFLFLFLNLI